MRLGIFICKFIVSNVYRIIEYLFYNEADSNTFMIQCKMFFIMFTVLCVSENLYFCLPRYHKIA